MNFVNTQYLPHIIVSSLALALLFGFLNKKYFAWVKSYWFFERSWWSRLSSWIYMLSLVLMLGALLDLRGPEQKIKAGLPDQKTIIILDSSASMLSEDIRPNRFGKAIQMARHFVKSAAGHQIAIVLFSDIQKRLIPFTDDIDLLDSRLAALEKTNAVSGGSNISQAIAEGAGYFDFDGEGKSPAGNILVFTDAEESEDGFKLELGSNVNLAVVGIGTVKGGNIPLRWDDGSFRGYKNTKGEPVVTKLDEEYIRKLGSNVKNYKYWIANSYSLPTEDILNFFRGNYNKTQGQGDMRVRPVFSHWILIPAIILYCLSVLLGRFASFKNTVGVVLLLLSMSIGSNALAQEEQEKPAKPRPVALQRGIEKMKSGKADRKEVLKVAENLLKNDESDKALELYSEYGKKEDDQEVLFNRTTALLKLGKLDEAMPSVQQILKESKNEEIKNRMRHNLLLALKRDDEKKKSDKNDDKKDQKKDEKEKDQNDKKDKDGKSDDKKDDKNQDNKDQKDKKDGKDGKSGKDNKQDDKQNDKQNSQDKQNGKDNKEEDDKDKDKDKKDPKDLDVPEREDKGPSTLEEKEKMIETKRKMVKTPAMIKQILSDDRELQKKLMDTSTNKNSASKPKRDW